VATVESSPCPEIDDFTKAEDDQDDTFAENDQAVSPGTYKAIIAEKKRIFLPGFLSGTDKSIQFSSDAEF
jgi:hypothetical protein